MMSEDAQILALILGLTEGTAKVSTPESLKAVIASSTVLKGMSTRDQLGVIAVAKAEEARSGGRAMIAKLDGHSDLALVVA